MCRAAQEMSPGREAQEGTRQAYGSATSGAGNEPRATESRRAQGALPGARAAQWWKMGTGTAGDKHRGTD